ncbi:hypothetical protein LK994_03780 [Ferruginibacter lapsinanis]|uniref:hypothetical protein n=1 Tax=Ferruginibacter lapsinanis TaxID=563172 RepID=UPI001E5F25D8|nr:hypothetical protein [Ferruginibacter lapsinanis]UEG50590.1 hypothetical protein LK994_03780 [Ferruginibacter lapsinanis]
METAYNKEELIKALSRATALNESLKEQLQDCENTLSKRNRQIDSLEKKIDELTLSNSQLNNYLIEVKQLESNIDTLKYNIDQAKYINSDLEKQVDIAVSSGHSLSDLEQKYTHLQTQLTDLQNQIQNLNDRNLILQQKNSRIAELESLLAEREGRTDFNEDESI